MMKRIIYILSAICLLSCKEDASKAPEGVVVTKDVTDISGNTAIGHGGVIINDGKNTKIQMSVFGKGIILSTDKSSLEIASHEYHSEALVVNGNLYVYAYSYTPASSKAKIFLPEQYAPNTAFDCSLNGLQYNTKYYVRAFAHISYGDQKVTYVYESYGNDIYIYGEIKEFVTGSYTEGSSNSSESPDPSIFVPVSSLRIGVLKEDLPSTIKSGFYAELYVNQFNFNGGVGGYRDWRLPTLNELKEIYKLQTQIGGFKQEVYWSGSVHSQDIYYYYWDFATNASGYASLHHYPAGYMRLVRPLP